MREAAEQLGYEADPIARALAGGSTAVVGLLVGSLSDFWNQELVRAVQRSSMARRAARSWPTPTASRRSSSSWPSGSSTSASTAWSSCRSGPASGGWASIARQVATVTIGDALPGVAPAGEVIFDYELRRPAEPPAPQRLGHRRVTVLSWAVETSPDREAERAVVASAAALGLDCRVVPCATRSTAHARSRSSCSPSEDRPAAILCMSDSIAYGVYAACAELELAIPGDVAVAGFGDHPISGLLSPPLTSTVWDVEQVAGRATEFLLAAIAADGPQATLREVVAPVLVARASTGWRAGRR